LYNSITSWNINT